MLLEDIIYVVLLLLCIAFGPYYRKIKDPNLRQWVGTIVGFFIVTVVSGYHIHYLLICCFVNAFIITKVSWRISHVASFVFSFFHLLGVFRLSYLFFDVSEPSSHMNLALMIMTLKLSGLAFEINKAATTPKDDPSGDNSVALQNIGFLDIMHYAFGYIGVLTGPYYRYRTYWDSIHRPAAESNDFWEPTRRKLIQCIGFVVIYLICTNAFPAKYTMTEEFQSRSFFYQFFFMYPAFVTFRSRLYVGMALSECVCQTAGLGAYPISSQPVSGNGPVKYTAFEELYSDKEKLKKEEINFETVHNMDVWEVEKCHVVRITMKKWNTCVQYWMAICVYKRFPIKPLRTLATFLISALWHGYSAGYYICICSVPAYLPMENIYDKLYKQSPEGSLRKQLLFAFLWFMKTTCMAYLGVSFQLLSFYESWVYYKNIYFAGHILTVVCYIMGLILTPYLLTRADKKTATAESKEPVKVE